MARLTPNALLPILAVAVVAAGGYAAWLHITRDRPQYVLTQPRTALPETPKAPDTDTPTDTIKKLIAEQSASNAKASELIKQNQTVIEQNARLGAEVRKLQEEISQRVNQQVRNLIAQDSHRGRVEVNQLEAEVRKLRDELAAKAGGGVGPIADSLRVPGTATPAELTYAWLAPLDQPADGRGRAPAAAPAAFTPGGQPSEPPFADRLAPAASPRFTISNLASLLYSTSWTALIGRVPRKGSVQDPVPFKVLVGRDNLAASGLDMPPEIFGMVMGGTAVGDLTLSCVYGHLTTATFIFTDGTIRTVDRRRRGGGGGTATAGGGTEDRIGYLTDAFGTPCIAGSIVSSGEEGLAARAALTFGTAAAEAFAAAETTAVTGGALGTTTTAVTGDPLRYALGRSMADTTKAINQYFAERLNDTFDAVFVPAGRSVGIQIDQELAIDYQPQGRKLDHGQGITGVADDGATHLLD
jgi:cell division protein ZapB